MGRIMGRVLFAIAVIFIAVLAGLLLAFRSIPPESVAGFFGVLFGGLITGFVQYWIAEADRRQQLRLGVFQFIGERAISLMPTGMAALDSYPRPAAGDSSGVDRAVHLPTETHPSGWLLSTSASKPTKRLTRYGGVCCSQTSEAKTSTTWSRNARNGGNTTAFICRVKHAVRSLRPICRLTTMLLPSRCIRTLIW